MNQLCKVPLMSYYAFHYLSTLKVSIMVCFFFVSFLYIFIDKAMNEHLSVLRILLFRLDICFQLKMRTNFGEGDGKR
jgi:hypothetical protein